MFVLVRATAVTTATPSPFPLLLPDTFNHSLEARSRQASARVRNRRGERGRTYFLDFYGRSLFCDGEGRNLDIHRLKGRISNGKGHLHGGESWGWRRGGRLFCSALGDVMSPDDSLKPEPIDRRQSTSSTSPDGRSVAENDCPRVLRRPAK